MAHVGFYRADIHAVVPKDITNCSCFCWVTYWGAGSMALSSSEIGAMSESTGQDHTYLDEGGFRWV